MAVRPRVTKANFVSVHITTPHLIVLSEDSRLLTIASKANITTTDSQSVNSAFNVPQEPPNLLEEDVRMKPATVNAVCTSPPMDAHAIPTIQELSHGIDPAMAIRVVFQPSTNSTAWRLSLRRSLKTQRTQSSLSRSCSFPGLE